MALQVIACDPTRAPNLIAGTAPAPKQLRATARLPETTGSSTNKGDTLFGSHRQGDKPHTGYMDSLYQTTMEELSGADRPRGGLKEFQRANNTTYSKQEEYLEIMKIQSAGHEEVTHWVDSLVDLLAG